MLKLLMALIRSGDTWTSWLGRISIWITTYIYVIAQKNVYAIINFIGQLFRLDFQWILMKMLQTSSEMIWKKNAKKFWSSTRQYIQFDAIKVLDWLTGQWSAHLIHTGGRHSLYFLRRSTHTRMTRRKNEIFDCCSSNLLRKSLQKSPVIFRISTFYLGATTTTTRSRIKVVVDSAFIVVKHKTSVSLLMRLEPSSWLFYDVMCAVESPARLGSALFILKTLDVWHVQIVIKHQQGSPIKLVISKSTIHIRPEFVW